MEEKTCDNCRHRALSPYEKPCYDCTVPELKSWEPEPPPDITSVDQLKDGPLLEKARAMAKRIERLDYAIAGVWSQIATDGIKLTDKTLSRDGLALLVGQLNALQADLFELEEEREALINGGKCPSRERIE